MNHAITTSSNLGYIQDPFDNENYITREFLSSIIKRFLIHRVALLNDSVRKKNRVPNDTECQPDT